MSLSVAALKKMQELGLTLEQVVELAEVIEATADAKPMSDGAERTRRWRERKAEAASSPRDVTGDVTGDVTETRHAGDEPPLALPPSPQTPQPPTHTPPDITTRAKPSPLAKPNGFARFWEAYPNKVAKPAAEAAYAKACRKIDHPDPPSVLLEGLERAKQSRSWADGYIPHPTTWLNQGRWDDQPSETPVIDLKARQAHAPRPDAKLAAKEANLARSLAGFEAASRMRAGS